jgi:mannosyltransferase OCH1-like enzyme
MEKYIHYCWFGNKKKPKLVKKCIKSWKKSFPDYKIMLWDESNFDVNITEFSKKAYQEKKWAFVSDVARVFALQKYGGIYFDTDMLVIKKIEDIVLNCDFFAGWESYQYVAGGVIGSKNSNNQVINDLWDIYSTISFSESKMESLTFPILLTKILKEKYGLKKNNNKILLLKKNIFIYPEEYFYPISPDNSPYRFTSNTRMIHYYNGSWVDQKYKMILKIKKIFGEKLGNKILLFLVFCKRTIIKLFKK